MTALKKNGEKILKSCEVILSIYETLAFPDGHNIETKHHRV